MSDANSGKPPTQKARQLARQEGQVALSADLAAAVGLIGSAIIVYLYSGKLVESTAEMLTSQLTTAHVTSGGIETAAATSVARLFRVLGECILAILTVVVVAWTIQTGFLFAITRVAPDASRVNPIQGIQRLVSGSNLTSAVLSLVKIAIIGGACYAFFRSNVESFAGISQLQVPQLVTSSGTMLYELMLICTGALVLIGIVDYAVKRNQFEASLSSNDDESRSAIRSVVNDPSSAQANRYRAPLLEETPPGVK